MVPHFLHHHQPHSDPPSLMVVRVAGNINDCLCDKGREESSVRKVHKA